VLRHLSTALLCACLALPADAQPSNLADHLLAAYSGLETYCAHATDLGYQDTSGKPRELEHCALRDGRYKNVATTSASVEVEWSDGEFHESYGRVESVRMDAAGVPPLLSLALRWYGSGVADVDGLRAMFRDFEPSPELSTPELAAYEAVPEKFGFEVTEVRVDRPVPAAYFTHEVPADVRLMHAVKEHIAEIALAVSVLAFLAGFAYWRLRTPPRMADARVERSRHWRIYRRVLLWTVVPAFGIALFAPTGGDMSGAARMLERLFLVAAYVYLLWLTALFLLARHFAESPSPDASAA
jgi:hypothetical protein